jgi:hypothetical protein
MARWLGLDHFVPIVGVTFVKREKVPLVQIGNVTFDRRQLGQMGLVHPMAARKLNQVLQELRIRTFDALAKELPQLLHYKGCGVTTYFACLMILQSQGFNPQKPHGADHVSTQDASHQGPRDRRRASSRGSTVRGRWRPIDEAIRLPSRRIAWGFPSASKSWYPSCARINATTPTCS